MNNIPGFPPMDEERRLALEAALEESRRIGAEDTKKRYERNTKNAIAKGFSSWEEECQIRWDEGLRQEAEFEQELEEKAAAAGKTVAEIFRELYPCKELTPPSPIPSFSQCDCEEHPSVWFCPANLIEYRSQKRPDFWECEQRNRTKIETLRIEPNEKSRRLNPFTLGKAWGMIGPATLELPVWARAKPEFLAMPRAGSKTPVENLRQNTPSLASLSLGDSSSPITSIATPKSPSQESKHPISPSHESKHTIRSKSSKFNQPSKRRAPFTAYEKRHVTKIVKHPQPPARRTRSHKTALFYELDRNGDLRASRTSRKS